MNPKILKLFFITILLFSFACQNEKSNKNSNDYLLNATAWYQQSAEMRACYLQAFKLAQIQMKENLNASKDARPKAVIVDIDETMLDNSPFEVYLINNDLSYSNELWTEWVKMEAAKALPGALDFALFAKQNNVEVFYISNRSLKNYLPTLKNLVKEGFPFADSAHIILKDETSDKSARREFVGSSHDILLLVGDNLRDFDEMFKERSDNFGFKTVDDHKNLLGTRYIILPNPMYGEWQKLYNVPNEDISEQQKLDNMKHSLKGY